MISIYKKVKISFFLIFILFIALLSGLFRDVITFFLIIIFHELGHVCSSYIFKWKIDKIEFSICGGYITYNEVIDKPFKEEFLIAISGFLFQVLLFFITNILGELYILDLHTLYLINKYNLSILFFNMLPVYPLDGSKIVYILINKYLPYKKSLKIIIIISIIFILLFYGYFLITNRLELSYIILISFILSKIIKYKKDIPYLFNKLLFERYVYPITTNKYNYIMGNNINLFKRQKKNIFKINKHYIKESVILSKKFD